MANWMSARCPSPGAVKQSQITTPLPPCLTVWGVCGSVVCLALVKHGAIHSNQTSQVWFHLSKIHLFRCLVFLCNFECEKSEISTDESFNTLACFPFVKNLSYSNMMGSNLFALLRSFQMCFLFGIMVTHTCMFQTGKLTKLRHLQRRSHSRMISDQGLWPQSAFVEHHLAANFPMEAAGVDLVLFFLHTAVLFWLHILFIK